jgi:hypothetical protein
MEQNINGISYQYQVLRYRHDAFTGEFANLGIVYFNPDTNYLKSGFISKYGRLSQFFGEVSGTALMRVLRQLQSELTQLESQLRKETTDKRFKSVSDLTNSILPKDDNALFFSEVFTGWNFEHKLAFEQLFDSIITKYQEPATVTKHDDSYAWKTVYKKYFDEFGITPKLKPKKVKTALTSVDFDKTVKNGALHCFQSLSFDLKHEGSIEDKIFRWDGRIRELATSKEPLKVYLLSVLPKDEELLRMINEKLNYKSGQIEVQVVDERHARSVAMEVNKVLEESHE